MKRKLEKEDLRNPDAFVSTSDKIFNFVEHNLAIFVSIGVAALVVSLAFVGYHWMNNRREIKAAEALYVPEAALKKAESEIHAEAAKKAKEVKEAEAKAKTKGKANTQKGKKEDTPSEANADADQGDTASVADDPAVFAKNLEPLVEKIKEQLKSHGDTKAGLVSALNLSYFLAQHQRFSEALQVLDLVTYHPSSSELLAGFWMMHRGLLLVENNQVDAAVTSFESVIGSEGLKVFRPEALLKLGVCYEMKGDAAKARQTYEKLSHEFPETEASSEAQQYMRLLDLKNAEHSQQPG